MSGTVTTSELKASVLGLNGNWLDAANQNQTALVLGQTSNCIDYGGLNNYYGNWTYPVYVRSPERPIKLTLSEVERLRKLAKADPKVKDILSRFTRQIEIVVDFE